MTHLLGISFHFGGEYFGNSSTNYFIDFLKILIPLIAGFLLSRGTEFWDKRKKQKKAIHDLLTEIRLLKEPIRLQSEEIKGFIVHLKNEKEFTTPTMTMQSSLLLERIDKLDRTLIIEFLSRYLKNRSLGLERTNKIFGNLELIRSHITDMKNAWYEYKQRASVQVEVSNDAIDQIYALRAEHLVELERNEIEPHSDKYYQAFDPMFEKMREDKKHDFFEVNEYFVLKLIEANAEFRLNPRAALYREQLYNHNRSLRKLKQLRSEMVVRFENYFATISSCYSRLEEFIRDLKV